MEIRPIKPNEIAEATELVRTVFEQFTAPDYNEDGIAQFMRVANYNYVKTSYDENVIKMFVACEDEKIVGVTAIRLDSHIMFMDVDGAYQRRGIGRSLLTMAVANVEKKKITVNAAPKAVGFYKRCGFLVLANEQLKDGVRFVPMSYTKLSAPTTDEREVVLSTSFLAKKYGKQWAVDHVNLTVRRGDVYGLVGKNGAGKTTLMRLVSGLISKTEGSYTLLGVSSSESAKRRATALSKCRVMIEGPAIYPNMTARQNLIAQCCIMKSNDDIDALIADVGLSPTEKKKVKSFSMGMRQRLAIAMAFIGSPEFLILDEPTNGLDPEGIAQIRHLLQKLNREKGVTIIISSHILGELSKLATHYGFIDSGKLIKEISEIDLEKECTGYLELIVSDTTKAEEILSRQGYKYEATTRSIRVFGNADINKIVGEFNAEQVRVESFSTKSSDLEEYYMRLLGGAK